MGSTGVIREMEMLSPLEALLEALLEPWVLGAAALELVASPPALRTTALRSLEAWKAAYASGWMAARLQPEATKHCTFKNHYVENKTTKNHNNVIFYLAFPVKNSGDKKNVPSFFIPVKSKFFFPKS